MIVVEAEAKGIMEIVITLFVIICFMLPASVAQLDARPTGDHKVAGSTPAEVGNILSWRLIMKYFLRSFSPFRRFKTGLDPEGLKTAGLGGGGGGGIDCRRHVSSGVSRELRRERGRV